MNQSAVVDVPTVRLFGLDFANTATVDEIARRLFDRRDERNDQWRCVITPNVDHLVRYRRHPLERDVADHAGLVLPDGMPIVWASRLLRSPLSSRLTGADLFAELWRLVAQHRVPTVIIASRQEVADRLALDHPDVRCIVPPMFDIDDSEAVDALIEETAAVGDEVGARFLVVGVSMPKHHLIAHRLRQRWEGDYAGRPTTLLLGQSPEFAVGLVRRAPGWVQRSGFEWVWRLAGDPARLAKRYLVDDVAFLPLVWNEYRARARDRNDAR